MSAISKQDPGTLRLKLPATSANLGPGFDAAAVALDFHLEIEAETAPEFVINATGREALRCARLKNNLILEIYERLLRENDRPVTPISIRMVNGIPLGMGCGSSAAGRLAAVTLAVHFGRLGWGPEQILEEACVLEGHPDNAAACWLGGLVVAASEGRTVHVVRVVPPAAWRAIVVLPPAPLPTSEARAMLPASYSRSDTVANIQAASMLGLAFAQGRGDLLRIAMKDRIHQPYRAASCPMLPLLLPLAGRHGILGAALSGAGPAVLVVVEREESIAQASTSIRAAVAGMPDPELLVCPFECEGANRVFQPQFRVGTESIP